VRRFNNALDAVIGPLNVAAEYVEHISNGDMPAPITDNYNGDFNEIKRYLNITVKVMNNLLSETDKIVQAAANGALDTRADDGKFRGGWHQLVAGVNDTLDKVIELVNEAAQILDKLADNDLAARVVGQYKGDHAKIKESLNRAMDTLENALHQVSDATFKVGTSSESLISTATEVGRASQQIAEASSQVAAGAQNQARTVHSTVGSVQQITGAIDEVASSAREVATTSQQVSNVATEGGQQVADAVGSMDRIKEATDRVAEIVKHLGESS
jgi:methyl-accepting chemotaxis protein